MAVHAKGQTSWTNQSVALKMWLQIMGKQMLKKTSLMLKSTRQEKKIKRKGKKRIIIKNQKAGIDSFWLR